MTAPAPPPFSIEMELPFMNWSLLTLSEVASRPPTSMVALWPKYTPLGLTSQTWPLALRRPRICEGSCPTTWFSATELALGWL